MQNDSAIMLETMPVKSLSVCLFKASALVTMNSNYVGQLVWFSAASPFKNAFEEQDL